MIDLHTHTTASDGRCSSAELVARAAAAGVTTLSVTDHDTTAGIDAAVDASAAAGIELVPGIEITAVADGGDVHVLGYFIDRRSPALQRFLHDQRESRIRRVEEMIGRLADQGIRLDVTAVLQPARDDPSKAAGRPWIARALVAGGHAADTNEAFRLWLQRGSPAFVPRTGATPAVVCERIHEAGGVASLAHPGLLRRDEWIPGFAAAGLDAVEAYHSDHEAADIKRYLAIAARLRLAVSGGSDYHADEAHGSVMLGSVNLPPEHFEALRARVHRS